jgi:hypothetical protein
MTRAVWALWHVLASLPAHNDHRQSTATNWKDATKETNEVEVEQQKVTSRNCHGGINERSAW